MRKYKIGGQVSLVCMGCDIHCLAAYAHALFLYAQKYSYLQDCLSALPARAIGAVGSVSAPTAAFCYAVKIRESGQRIPKIRVVGQDFLYGRLLPSFFLDYPTRFH